MTKISGEIETHLPLLRRYARAVTGSRRHGDHLTEATLVSILNDTGTLDTRLTLKVAMFRLMQDLWCQGQSVLADDLSEVEMKAHKHLAKLTPGSREALLLRAFEKFSDHEIGEIIRTPAARAAELVKIARLDLARSLTGRVLVIEDEAAIAAEIETIVHSMGHTVIGSARTRHDAVRLASFDEPDLIVSDIQLADNTSGLDAVEDILNDYPLKPVIYVTAYPELLLTGVEQDPAFLVTKPYTPDEVRSAISQAMFFSPREG